MSAGGETSQLPVSDADLARGIALASPGAAQAEEAELYRRFAPRVRLYGLKHLRDEAGAQDLVQQVLLVTIERLRAGEVRKPEEIGSFILGTSRVMAGALQRTERRRQSLVEQFKVSEIAEEPSAYALDVALVERCLQTLSQRDRAVLILTFYAEKTSADIAEELGLTSGVVRVARHRALDRLRECVGLRRSA
jgi:RNA polymerase sigma-70 factor (ECF subfamily)